MPPVATTSLRADEVMNRAAALMNDPARTDYTYSAILPYLNMAIDDLVEQLEEANASPSNQTSASITVAVGEFEITPVDSALGPHYPFDLVEIQEVGERLSGSTDTFLRLERKEFLDVFPINPSLLFWIWEDQKIKFNPNGASTEREIQLKYVRMAVAQALNENSLIGAIGARSFLSFKTAALCAMFIGENETRAEVLEGQAQKAIERMLGINSKGRQQIVTRRRPFRAGYKSRGWI